MNLMEMIVQASVVVQLVMLLLTFMSVYVWLLLFAKLWQVRALYKQSKTFKQKFESSKDLVKLFNSISTLKDEQKRRHKLSPLEKIFIDGFAEFMRQTKVTDNELSIAVKSVRNRMWQAYNRQLGVIEQRVSTLATIGSSAPYIGLFGTVWGVINAFQGLGQVQHATLALVAPGISEALVATAMGLFVAIPAVVGYNRLQSATQRLAAYFEDFIDTFSRLTERQLLSITKQGARHSAL